jgi:Ca2+-binding EF-hand superfamily protein
MKNFLAILAVSLLTITAAQAAEFAEVDTDGDGAISMDEAVAMTPDLTEDAFKAADTDADGGLNADEFAAMSN